MLKEAVLVFGWRDAETTLYIRSAGRYVPSTFWI